MWIGYDSYWSYWPFQRRSTCKMAQGSTDYELWLYHAFCLETQLGNRWVPSTFQTAQTGNQQRSWGDAQQQEHLGDDLYVTWPKKITELGMMCCRFCFIFFSDFYCWKAIYERDILKGWTWYPMSRWWHQSIFAFFQSLRKPLLSEEWKEALRRGAVIVLWAKCWLHPVDPKCPSIPLFVCRGGKLQDQRWEFGF